MILSVAAKHDPSDTAANGIDIINSIIERLHSLIIFLETKRTGIRRMGPGSDARISQFGAFDKAEPSWRAPREPKMADDRVKPLLRQGIWTNCLPSERTSPVVWLELMTPRTLYDVDAKGGGRSSAIIPKMSANRSRGMATSAIWKAT